MATNRYISQAHRPEQNLYEDLIIESIQFYGQDVYYLPREIVNKDQIFLDDVPSRFSDSYKIEMYVENTGGFDGEGDMFTKFGIELRDQATFIVARKRWRNLIGDYLEAQKFRPREGDLIFLPMSQSIFQIMKVETETPFYQLSQLPTFRLQCELFEYSDEDFDTGIDGIDVVEAESAFKYKLTMALASQFTAQLTAEIDYLGRVVDLDIVNPGVGYITPPTVTVAAPEPELERIFGNSSLSVLKGRGEDDQYDLLGPNGSIEFFALPAVFPAPGEQDIFFVTGGNQDNELAKMLLIGIDENGYIGYSSYDNGGASTITLTAAQVTLGLWQHIAFFTEGTDIKIFINGSLSDTITMPFTNDFFTLSGFALGANAARTVDGISWNAFKGYIDEFRAQVGDFATLLTPRLDGLGDLIIPITEFEPDAKDAHLEHYNGTTAEVTVDITGGQVVGGEITNQGLLYNSAPSVTVAAPAAGGSFFTGQTVTQSNGSYTMKGEVSEWNSDTLELTIVHNGATDGKFHEWMTEVVVSTDTATWIPVAIEEIQDIQVESQNEIFSDFASDFLDFSEQNPFGDPI